MSTENKNDEVANALIEARREIESARWALSGAEDALRDAEKVAGAVDPSDSIISDLLALHRDIARDSVFAPHTTEDFRERLERILLDHQVLEVVMAR